MAELLELREKVAKQDGLASKLLELEMQLAQIASNQSTKEQFPEQWKAGVVAYNDKYPFPMVVSQELFTHDGRNYGETNDIARALFKLDVDNPTFLARVSADLFKRPVQGNTGLVGSFLPLSSRRTTQYDPALTYEGRDFWWRITASSDDRQWQTEWRSSAQLDDDFAKGYVLPAEYEIRRNDTLTIEAQPIGEIPDPVQSYSLIFHFHIYKMLQKRG